MQGEPARGEHPADFLENPRKRLGRGLVPEHGARRRSKY